MKYFKHLIEELNLNYRHELLIFILINFVFIALSIFLYVFIRNIIYVGMSFTLLLMFNALNVYRLYELKSDKHYKELSSLLYLFNLITINVHNKCDIVTSFKNIKDITDLKLNTCVSNFIEAINEDKSINPYLAFAHNYSSIQIEELMINLYLTDLNNIDIKLSELNNELNDYNARHSHKLFEIINLLPIVSVMILISIAIICIINNIQG